MTRQTLPQALFDHGRGEIGICCSGGGIRAAAYGLGCLQVLDERGVLRGPGRARYISAVSGGSYAVGAMALIQRSIETASPEQPLHGGVGPYAQGSPELRRLRNRLGYLTHGPGGVQSELWRALMGVVMNVALLLSVVAIVAYVSGWVYGGLFRQLRYSCGRTSPSTCSTAVQPAATPWTWQIAVGLGVVALAVGVIWVARRWSSAATARWQTVSVGLVCLAAGWAVVVLGLPQLLAWLHRTSLPRMRGDVPVASTGLRDYWISAGGLGGVAVALAGVFVPVWQRLRSITSREPAKGLVAGFVARHRQLLLNLLTLMAVPLLFGSLLVVFMHQAAERSIFVRGTSPRELWYVIGPAAFLAVVAVWGDLNNWSLHTIYRARLGEAFDLERTTEVPADSPTVVDGIDVRRRNAPVPLSELRLTNFPEVLIGATSNIRNYGLVPTGSGAVPFVFSQDIVGGPIVGELYTKVYEIAGLRSSRSLTVMDAISISGAAVAPQMGRMTRPPLRMLLALANIRLGVWIPKPNAVRRKAARKERQLEDALTTTTPSNRRWVVKPPGLVYLVREAIGTPPPQARHVYVTDGGHYDNLGLVELLKRRCAWIWCIDASGDHIDTFTTLGQALATAQAEYGISVNITPRANMAPAPATPDYVRAPFCCGEITYPPETPAGNATTGTLVVIKAGVPDGAPWAIDAYHAAHPTFPCDSTVNQLYNADRFDAYLALGRFATTQAFDSYAGAYRHLEDRIRAATPH